MPVIQYAIAINVPNGAEEAKGVVNIKCFRVRKIYTNLAAPKQAFLTGLYCGQHIDNQLTLDEPLDLWAFSLVNIQAQQREFLKEHELLTKTDAEIQRYLDDNELSLPDAPALFLPTLGKDDVIRITGKFSTSCGLSFVGDTREG